MASVLLALYGVIAATLLMILLHMHLAQVKALNILNTVAFVGGSLTWPLVLIAIVYLNNVRRNRQEEHLQRGLSDGRWRTALSRVSTDYEIDGEAFKRYEQRERGEVDKELIDSVAQAIA